MNNLTPTNLRARRKALDLSMKESAEICRVPYRTWCAWELGEYPMPKHALTLLEYLELKHKRWAWTDQGSQPG